MTRDQLLAQFHDAMLGIYEAAKRLKPPYTPNDFRRMVLEMGGKGAADKLLAMGNPSEGFGTLLLRGKDALKLSVEYVVLQSPWRDLFEPEQLAVARKRLIEVKCDLPPEDSDAVTPPAPETEVTGTGLAFARRAFIDQLKAIAGTPVEEFTVVLDDFISWSGQHDWAVEFHEKEQQQKVVRYVVRGTTTNLWVAYPQVKDSKLSIIDAQSGPVTRNIQDWAIAKLHKLGVGQPKDVKWPVATFEALLDPAKREVLKGFFVELFGQLKLTAPPEPTPEPPPRIKTTVTRVARDTAIALWVKQIHEYRCQVCGERIDLPDGRHYAEAHHIRPLGQNGLDVKENVLCVCPNHHAALDLMARDINLAELRKAEGHTVGAEHVQHHNSEREKRWK